MMNIIVYGDEKDTTISDTLLKTFAKYGGVQFSSSSKLVCMPKNRKLKFFIFDTNKLPLTTNINGIFLFKNSFKHVDASKIPENFFHIIDSQNRHAIKCLKKADQVVLTYGIDAKSTLTFSSLTATDAMINLQRYVKTKNKILEPHEFLVKLNTQLEPNLVLLVCAVLLFSEVPSTDGYEI